MERLRSGGIGGGLYFFAVEPLVAGQPLWSMCERDCQPALQLGDGQSYAALGRSVFARNSSLARGPSSGRGPSISIGILSEQRHHGRIVQFTLTGKPCRSPSRAIASPPAQSSKVKNEAEAEISLAFAIMRRSHAHKRYL